MTIGELENTEEYDLKEELTYTDVVPFVMRNIKRKNLATYAYYSINFFFLLVFLFMAERGVKLNLFGWGTVVVCFFTGLIIIPIPLVPVHELIHAAVYRLFGARNLRFGMNRSQYFFYVAADRHVTGFVPLLFIALAPFMVLSTGMMVAFSLINTPVALAVLAGVFSHGIMCIGDFAMLSYFLDEGPENLYTFDKVEEQKAYFFKRRKVINDQ